LFSIVLALDTACSKEKDENMRVAWIGLGHMGLPTSKMVAAGGHEVRGYDIKSLEPHETQGLKICGSAQEAAADCDLVCVALFSDDQVEETLVGKNGLFPMLKPGAVVAVFTTGTIESAKRLAAQAPAGVTVLDTCFSRAGSMSSPLLNLLVGGDAAALNRCRSVFETFSHEIFHLGVSGAGRAMKLINNILWVAHNQLAMDALDFAAQLGFDRYETAKIIEKCSGASRVTSVFSEPYEDIVAYMRPFMIKDASAAVEAAREAGADLGTLGAVVKAYVQ
jgi:3-hydroxyisobutyrate dehydrogenase-like beta-hydroxyacid dehydrogenase